MKNLTFIRIAAAAGVTLSLATPAMAAEENGVTCRAGTTATKSPDNTNLKCHSEERVTRLSNCLNLANGVNGLQQVVRTGPDMCTDPTSSANAGAPKPVLLPNDPPNGWTREDTPGGRDIFVRTIVKYEFPQGAVFNPLDNESKGVTCTGTYHVGSSVNSGRGIRCEDNTTTAADCDAFWTLRVDDNGQNRDKCIGINGVGETKPKGMTNVQYQAQKGRWILDVNNGPDRFRHFGFPTSSR